MTSEMRDLLAKASVISEAAGAALAEPTSHSKPSDMAPRAAGPVLFDELFERFLNAVTDRERELAVRWARDELDRAKRTPQPEKGLAEVGSLAWKREIAQVSEHAKTADQMGTIAKRYSISRATVYNYRKLYGREAA